MIKYLKHKPIVQQTPYDQICIDLGRTEILSILGTVSIFLELSNKNRKI
jgi:hypothetical protein